MDSTIPVFVTLGAAYVAAAVDSSEAMKGASPGVRLVSAAVLFAIPSIVAWAAWLWYAYQQCRG